MKQPALTPTIISASRATDIPAFHGEWFAKAFAEGSCLWRNPFNGASYEVSFSKARFFVFWTKNPAPFMHRLKMLDKKKLGYYFLFTLNDYEAEGYEPGVPPLKQRIETFIKLSESIGPERTIWRFDPIILSKKLTPQAAVERIARIGEALKGHAEKLIISFVDIAKYKYAREHLSGCHEPSPDEIEEIACRLAELNNSLGLEIGTCAESVNLDLYGIHRSSCVDAKRIRRLAPDDKELMQYLDANSKDKGQRKDCLCVKSKDIGEYNTCDHNCLYCYANR